MKLGVISLGCDKATVDSERLVGERISQTSRRLGGGAVASLVLMGLIVSTVLQQPLGTFKAPVIPVLTTAVGETVLTRFVLPFELLALLMLAALMAAIYFARPEE